MSTVPASARTPMATRRARGRRALAIHRSADTDPAASISGSIPSLRGSQSGPAGRRRGW